MRLKPARAKLEHTEKLPNNDGFVVVSRSTQHDSPPKGDASCVRGEIMETGTANRGVFVL